MIKSYPYIRSDADFVSAQTGNWGDYTTWKIVGVDGVLYSSPYVPQRGNNVYIATTHSITLTQNEECKNLIYTPGEDLVKVNTGVYSLDVYGILQNKLGSYPGTIPTGGSGSGTAQWLTGTVNIKGQSRSIDFTDYRAAANKYGTTVNIYLDNEETLTLLDAAFENNAIAIGGTVNIHSGILKVDSCQMRIAQTRANLTANNGALNIYNGGKLLLTNQGSLSQNRINRSASTSLSSVTVNEGGILEVDSWSFIASTNFSMLGNVVVSGDSVVIPTGSAGFNGSVPITSFFNLILHGTGTKTAANNITINGKLSFDDSTLLDMASFSLIYGTDANLEITSNKTRGIELPSSGSGNSICKDLIIPSGVVYDLDGATVNIRGALIGGGSTTNGTLNENQP